MNAVLEISFSQAQTWRTCKKAWAYRYVNKRSGIPSIPAIRGNRYHSAIEDLINEGKTSTNEILSRAVAIFSRLQWTDVKPEQYLELYDESGEYKIRGYADVIGKKEEKTYVLDWKFPGKHPGKSAKRDYVRQLQLYGLMAGADTLVIAYPEHDVAFTFEAKSDDGLKVVDDLFGVAKEIDESGAFEVRAEDQTPTRNWSCAQYCDHRDVCPLGGAV